MADKDSDNLLSGDMINQNPNIVVIRLWDKRIESLEKHPTFETLANRMGFQLITLVETIQKEFPGNIDFAEEFNPAGEKIEDVAVEQLTVNGRALDRSLVKAYPPAANPNPTSMTQFQFGGEVILVTDGEAELTYANKISDGSIAKSDLKTAKVERGDLVISTNTPNNWTRIEDDFSFIYFVGNPDGEQKYSAIPKTKLLVK